MLGALFPELLEGTKNHMELSSQSKYPFVENKDISSEKLLSDSDAAGGRQEHLFKDCYKPDCSRERRDLSMFYTWSISISLAAVLTIT